MLHMNAWKDDGIGGGGDDGYNRQMTFYIHLHKIYAVHCYALSLTSAFSPIFLFIFDELAYLE